MKIRNGFVSNSSSSSFVIGLSKITGKQLNQIMNHTKVGKENGVGNYYDDPWSIELTDDFIRGETMLDNFSMRDFLAFIGVRPEDIRWEDY